MQQATIIEQNRQRGYERFEQNRRFEEATDVSERVGYHINTKIEYEMRDGAAYCKTDTVDRPFHEQTYKAWQRGQHLFTGANQFEAIRLGHEHAETQMLDDFGAGKLSGNVFVKISKNPDAVRDGVTDNIGGYREDLMRTFVRAYYLTDEGVSCKLFSLDQTDDEALAMVGSFLGIDASPGRSSEDILADYAVMDMSYVDDESIDELIQKVVGIYDSVLYKKTGEKTYAGSRFLDKENALSAVMRNGYLLDEHMREISKIMSLAVSKNERENMLEDRRKRTAAAITVAQEGGAISSGNDGSVTERMVTGNFDRHCATADEAVVSAMGMSQGVKKEREWKKGTCRVCFATGTVGECFVCQGCEAADNAGKSLDDIYKKALASQEQAKQRAQVKQSGQRPRQNKTDMIRAHYGEYAQVRIEKNIGGEDRLVVDRRSGEVIAKL